MGDKLELVRTNDFRTDQGTVSLLSLTDGFDVAYEGWYPQVVPDSDGRIREALTVRVQGTSIDHLATCLQGLSQKRIEAQRYIDNAAEQYAVFFRVQMDGETKARQSFVYSIDHESDSIYSVAARQKYHLNDYKIGIERAPWWEGTAAGTITGGTVNAFGGTFGYSGIVGDLAARMAEVKLHENTYTVGTADYPTEIFPWGQFWMGFRSNTYGTATDWVSQRPVYISGRGVGGGSTDSSSIGGTSYFEAFAPSDYVVGEKSRMTWLKMSDFTANFSQMHGKFLVLCRAKIGGNYSTVTADQFNIQMLVAPFEDHYASSGESYASGKWYPKVPINTSETKGVIWHLYELGEVEYPPVRAGTGVWGDVTLNLYAENTVHGGGTPLLFFDNLILIPTGEGYVKGGKRNTYYISTENEAVRVDFYGNNHPNGDMDGYYEYPGGTANHYGVDSLTINGGLPAGSGIVVVAGDSIASTSLNNNDYIKNWNFDVTIKYIERWETLRGSE